MPSIDKNKQPSSTPFLNYDGEQYKYSIVLYTKNKTVPIPSDNFVSLIIEQDINSPFYKGVIKFKNDNNRFDLQGLNLDQRKGGSFNFNLEETGENLIEFIIERQKTPIKYSLYIVDESTEIQNGTKIKNYFVEDSNLFYFKNNKKGFSTTELLNTDVSQLSDKNREVVVSDAIKRIIINTFNEEVIDENNWETSSNKIFYTSNINETILDSLDFLVFNGYDQNNTSLLLLKRNNKYGLYSINKMYNDYMSLKYQNNYGGNFLAINGEYTPETVKSHFSYQMKNYTIYNESSMDTIDNLINHKIVQYSYNNKKFNLFNKDNTIANLFETIKGNSLNKITTIKRDYSPSVKNNTYNKVLYTTTSDEETARYEGYNNLFKNLINFSTMLTFTSDGVFDLTPGNFINVNYNSDYYSDISTKLDGGWFVVGCKHKFTVNTFSTEVACSKFHQAKGRK